MATVVSAGTLQSLEPGYMPKGGASSYSGTTWWGLMADYATIWRTQPQVRKVCGFLARNMAQLGLSAFQRVSLDDRRRLDPEHPLCRVLAWPQGRNPANKLTTSQLIGWTVQDSAIYDNAYWIKAHLPDNTMRLYPLPPTSISPMGSDWLSPEAYQITGSAGTRVVPPEEVVHFRGYNPADRRLGLSPIETLRQMLMEDAASDEYREQLWRRGARMSGYLSRPVAAPSWSDKARDRFVDDWQAQYADDGPQAGGTPLLEDGMTWTAASFSAQESQWLEGKKFTLEQVTSAYHIPLPMVGILEHATFSNISEQHKQLYQDTLGPWCVSIEQDVDLQLTPDLDPHDATIYVEFNLAEKLKGSFEDQARAMQTMVGAPVMTRNEGRARLNLSRMDDPSCDELVLPMNVMISGSTPPTGTETPGAPTTNTQAFDPEDLVTVVGNFLHRQAKALTSQAGGGAVRFVRSRWMKELVTDLTDLGLTPQAAQLLAGAVNDEVEHIVTRASPAQLSAALGDPSDRATAVVARYIPEEGA